MSFTTLALRSGSGVVGDAQVFTLIGSEFTPLGDPLVGATKELTSTSTLGTNRVINAFGRVYAAMTDGLYVLQEGSNEGAWSKDS